MKKLFVILFLLICSVTYSQSGVGYLNYTTYLTHNGNGSTNQYPQFANSATDFVNMFNTANSNTTIYKQGTGSVATTIIVNSNLSGGVPRNNYWGVKVSGYFVPKESGLYYFGIDGDDGVDLSIDNNVVASFYGGHGFQGYRIGSVNLTAGQTYTIMARFQQYGGGWGMAVVWKRPSQNSYTTQADECYSVVANPSKKGLVNVDFGGTLDKTKFNIGSALSSAGSIDITNLLDSVKVSNGNYKMTLTPGQVEWVWAQASPFDRFGYAPVPIGVDDRKFNGIDPTKVTSVKFLDGYEGDMTYTANDGTWARYSVPSPNNLSAIFGTETNGYVGTSQYLSSIRNMGGGYMWGIRVEPSFTPIQSYKPQSVTITTTNTLSTLYSSIVTVSDVYLAFKELSNQGGLFGNSSNGGQFTYGIQYHNADVNDDGYFDEKDCYALLQNLTGAKSLIDTMNLKKTLKLISTTKYNTIGLSNWNTFENFLGDTYNFDINTGKATDTFNISATWKGDVNLSHSATPASNGITTMSLRTIGMSISNEINASIISEIIGDSVYAYITLDPLQQKVVGTQFQLNYDNSLLKFNKVTFKTKGSPTNYANDKGSYVNLGSLISDGISSLDNTTEYKISFTSKYKLNNIFGLISVDATDAVNQDGKQLKIKIN